VHVRRNPYDVYRSNRHLYKTIIPLIRLQRRDGTDWDARMVGQYKEFHAAFFAERGLIPAGRYHEVAFEDLEKDPVGQVRGTYDALGLPGFAEAEPRLRAYVDSIAQYRKNSYHALDPATRQLVAREWGRCFEAWGYPV
jgi:omega-hydroxy-beta-dihydromenaquinone-9 sulfotransferase